jgi:hypothetical protein
MSKTIKTTGENERAGAAICGACGLNMSSVHGWPATMEVYHCEGQSKAGRSHHHSAPTWGNCWHCGKPLGCAKCAAHTIAEALCRRCKVWGTKEAFVEQGLLGGQAIEDYPAGWHHDYFAARALRNGGAAIA